MLYIGSDVSCKVSVGYSLKEHVDTQYRTYHFPGFVYNAAFFNRLILNMEGGNGI